MIVRPEEPRDYAAITDVNIRAFDHRLSEALIVVLQRQRPGFDPDLAPVAEIDGRIVGNAVFCPQTLRLLGEDVSGVLLAPIAVDPDYQRRGIGKALIEHGHRVAREKGYALAVLVGHTEYYPQFGYEMNVYGASSVTVTREAVKASAPLVTCRPRWEDLDVLHALWRHEENAVDFALIPDYTLMSWLSPNPLIACTVYLRDERIVGYSRISSAEPASPRMFLAADADAAHAMCAHVFEAVEPPVDHLTLPLHPQSATSAVFPGAACRAWGAAMALPLAPSPFDAFLPRLRAGLIPPGRVQWATIFDVE
jgi:predicted N-acetyltransferase YhbS